MSLGYLCFGSYWRNLTSPFTHWHRGTAVQIDTMADHPEMQVVVGELGADVVVLTMATRITHTIFILTRNLYRRPLGLKIIPSDWKSKALQAVLWMFWNILDLLLAVEVTNVLVYKSLSKHSVHHTGESVNAISIKCHWDCKAELYKQDLVPEKDLTNSIMETPLTNTCMEDVCEHEMFSDMDITVSKETLLPYCTNPFILSMICVPSEDGESLLSEESDLEEESDGDCALPCDGSNLSKSEIEEIEKDSSHEDNSVDSGMQESWPPKSKEGIDDSEEEIDWSSDEDDSWDEEGEEDYSRDDDLWASFCRNDDPYNPLSFAMPTQSPKQEVKEVLDSNSEKHNSANSCICIAGDEKCEKLKCTMRPKAKKPVLSSFKCSHKCAGRKDGPENLEGVRKVWFSPNVTVHHMVTWSYACRMARKGPWEEYARDRSRFQKRIAETEATIGFCLEPAHREKIQAANYCKEKSNLAEGTL